MQRSCIAAVTAVGGNERFFAENRGLPRHGTLPYKFFQIFSNFFEFFKLFQIIFQFFTNFYKFYKFIQKFTRIKNILNKSFFTAVPRFTAVFTLGDTVYRDTVGSGRAVVHFGVFTVLPYREKRYVAVPFALL